MIDVMVVFSAFLAVVGTQIVQPAATAKPVSCSIPKTCASFTNGSTGSAVAATSQGGAGVFATSGSGNLLTPALDGESSNQSGNDAGAGFGLDFLATNNAPSYGALAFGSGIGLYGESEANGTGSGYAGVFGSDVGGGGSDPDYNSGVTGQTGRGTGVLGMSNGTPQYGIYGILPTGVYGVAEPPSSGISFATGVLGESTYIGMTAVNTTSTTNQTEVDLASQGDFISAYHGMGSGYFYVTTAGSATLSGTLTTSKGTYVHRASASGAIRRSYGAETTLPQIDDVGEAQMVDGRAAVAIDAALGDTIDMRRGYHVFVTPEADSKGLYVSQKTPTGFVVRESQGGRSTMAFEYRIVARPLHADEARLAIEAAVPDTHGTFAGRAIEAPRRGALSFLTPEARLKARIGTQAYAEALLERRNRLSSK